MGVAARAIAALKAGGVLIWRNRLVRQQVAMPGLERSVLVLVPWRILNAYSFRDPQPSKPLDAMLIRLGKAVGAVSGEVKEARG